MKRALRSNGAALQEAAGQILALVRASWCATPLDAAISREFGEGSAARVREALAYLLDGPLQDVCDGRPVLVALTPLEARTLSSAAGQTTGDPDAIKGWFSGPDERAAVLSAHCRLDRAASRALTYRKGSRP